MTDIASPPPTSPQEERQEQGMDKKYESDLTRKDKIILEFAKLKGLKGRKRVQYLWNYYKIILVIILTLILAFSAGLTIYRNLQRKPVLSMVIIDADRADARKYDALKQDLFTALNPSQKGAEVLIDTSASSRDDANEVMNTTIKLSIAEENDLVVCNQDTYRKFRQEGAFADWEEVLGEHYNDYLPYMRDEMLDLSLSPNWNNGEYTGYSPAYLCVLNHSKRLDSVNKAVEYFFCD